MPTAVKPVPTGYHNLTPFMTQEDSRKAIAWYKEAFGAEEMFVSATPQGVVMHALIRIGDSFIMMHDAMGQQDKSPAKLGGAPMGLWIYTEDCDALFDRAVKAGAKVGMPMTDMFWGDRFGFLYDPFGYGWAIATHKEDVPPAELEARAKKNYASQDCH